MRLSFLFLSLSLFACSKTEVIKSDPAGTDPKSADGTTPGSDTPAVTSGSRIKAKTLVADDGTKTNWGWHDTERDEDCSWALYDGRTRCLPTKTATLGTFFSDASCKKPIATATKGCVPPSVAIAPSGAWCADTGYAATKVYGVGAQFKGATMYSKSADGTCSSLQTTSYTASYDLYSIGDEISLDDFVAADVQ